MIGFDHRSATNHFSPITSDSRHLTRSTLGRPLTLSPPDACPGDTQIVLRIWQIFV
jgi:hypothetical protein